MDDFKSELLKMFVQYILPSLATALGLAITAAGGVLVVWIKRKADAEGQHAIAKAGLDVLARATELMRSVVAHVNVELAEPLRAASADGVITVEEGKALRAKALELFKAEMGAQGMAALKDALGSNVEVWLSGLLERVLVGQKIEAAKVGALASGVLGTSEETSP